MNSKKNLKRNLLICLLAGSAVMYTLPLHAATSVVANNALPQNGQFFNGKEFIQGKANEKGNGFDFADIGSITKPNDLTMNVHQNEQNAVIKWDSFDVGGSATVNFTSDKSNFNTLNYVNSGAASQIYGTINGLGGNIYVVNTAGVQIGNSAQINVGSLYVSNKYLNENKLGDFAGKITPEMINTSKNADAVLMSLGNINANHVTFEGDGRIVIDSERIKNENTNLTADEIFINTNDKNNVVIGYEAYENGSYAGVDKTEELATLNGNGKLTKANGYMWVEDVKQLQAIGENAETLTGNYALRNSIDATATSEWNGGNGFNPIGLDDTGKVVVHEDNKYGFTGNFDGIDYNIFGLNINQPNETNVGLFGVAHDANINNVTLVGGSITGGSVVGSVVGAALGNTHITNATNSASVTGNTDVGGIVGYSGDEISDGDNGNIIVNDTDSHFTNLVNTGTVHSNGENNVSVSNAGGLIGYMFNGTLDGNSYNLGDVSGDGYNVGGLVGHAVNSTIGDGTNLVYNRLDVTGAYNVGGIVGNMEGTAVQNAENSGNVLATGYRIEDYIYHTGETNKSNIPNNGSLNNGVVSVNVNVANVGGIAGKADDTADNKSKIENVTNSGDISSNKQTDNDYYDAGNVGGIVGSAVDTNITNATNRENEICGAHNVGGVVGYFSGSGTASSASNDGGDIMATGAQYNDTFVKEQVRPENDSDEEFIIGNIGGIVGYMDGDNVYVTGSANRGTVYTSEPTNPADVKDWEKAANVGGIVGKIDRSDTKDKNQLGKNYENAAVANSYNTGDVLGYTGIGGIAGLMYNGEIASSYNLGYLRSTRQSYVGLGTGTIEVVDALNMGGIVGDTTEESNAKALLYDVYNKGQIGDEEFNYFGRHVGGVVGRLSGTVEKAYNTGAIYNGYNVVGGIAGWVATGTIQNAFNTGNITVYNKNENTSQLGGIVGAANGGGGVKINNVYNLGTLRSFDVGYGSNAVAGILGAASGNGTVTITNAYTTGNLYSGKVDNSGNFIKDLSEEIDEFNNTTTKVNSIYAATEWGGSVTNSNTYYIRPDENLVNEGYFTDLYNQNSPNVDKDNSNKAIAFGEKSDINQYQYGSGDDHHSLTFTKQNDGDVDGGSRLIASDDNWRIYDGNTPILNAFLPDSEKYFSTGLKDNGGEFIGTIQYGTAYDPLLTIINTNRDLAFNFGSGTNELSISNAAGIAVYGGGLTFNNFATSSGTGYFGGTIYADGALNLNSNSNIGLGSAAQIYGSAVNINTDGKVTIYGDVTATGNIANGAIGNKEYDEKLPNAPKEIEVENKGDISINAGDVDVYGTLTTGKKVSVPGIKDQAVNTWTPGDVENPYAEMVDIADRFAHTTGASAVDGNITINAGTNAAGENIGNGNVNLYFGNIEQGLITTGGDLTVTGTGDVYVDSDLEVGKNMTLTSTGKDGEVLLTLTNIGKVQANKFVDVIESAINGKNINDLTVNDIREAVDKVYPELHFTEYQAELIIASLIQGSNKTDSINKLKDDISVAYMHDFMHSFEKPQPNTGDVGYKIALNAASGDAKLTVDMWEEDVDNTGKSGFDYTKYDTTFPGTSDNHTFKGELDNLNFIITNTTTNKIITDASKAVYVEVSTGEQLKAIQQAGDSALGYNYALMGDINASDVTDYEAIGGTTGFTGTFDGRGNRIIGLDTIKDENGGNINSMTNAGIFSTIGEGGTVKNVNIYSGNFEGTNTAGAVAGMNSGRIENVTGFGNTVTVTNKNGNAGGIVGVNNGNKGNIITNEDGTITLEPAENERFATGIIDVESIGSVIAKGNNAVAGGLVGTNDGALGNSYSDSAVTSTFVNNQAGLGGVVGVNTEKGNVQYVDSLGVTNGGTTGSSNVGGVIGINNGNMYSGYNESIVSGKDNVGGIIGVNTNTVSNIVNATGINGNDYVGGLVGDNDGNVSSGRNNGTITGNYYVGGMVGSNGTGSILENLVNAESADIVGENYVGGIAGTNSGEITADDQSTLDNLGTITGQNYVGGVAGENIGKIEYIETNISLNVKDTNEVAQYFGGVAGINGRVDDNPNDGVDNDKTGTITSATNEGNVIAADADYVGGIVGLNTANGQLLNSSNAGRVEGANYVGGVAGKNEASITGEANDLVTIDNSGVVIAHEGGAGGIFGENTGNIKYAELTNNGIVSGTYNVDKVAGTGGLIGVNSGEIKHSSLKNNIGGQVIGTQNVGGLIGVNTGNIEGGRDEANSYYKYQIYNNGIINVGTWNDADKDGAVDTDEITLKVNGTNIGGLFGTNSCTVKAAYNTGAINASASENVGGIAGTNSGTLDQVFNTVMVADGATKPDGSKQETAITGDTNVGGLVGTNSGTLSNAYNTTAVEGSSSNVGNAVGNNTTGTITNIYASNTSGKLIGNNINTAQDAIQNAYSFVKDDTSTVLDEKVAQKAEESYGFDNKDDGTTWKFYNGYSNPLLKVFLTKAEYTTGNKDFTYNATDQGLTINSNTITAADKLDAYNNANSLLTATQNKNAGEGYLGIYSQQIATSGKGDAFDPNNLGYDIDVTYNIKKKQLNITLDDVHRVYGNVAITQGGYQISNIDGWQGSDKDLANGITISPANDKDSFEQTDTALTCSNTGKVTENAGGQYTWSADVTLSEEIAQNYEITTTTLTGNSYVGKAKLTININDVTMTYGDKESTISNQYGYTVNNGLVNGDSLEDVIADMNYNNTAYNTDGTTKNVIDGKYALQDKDVTGGSKYGNYEITINDGEVTMGKAQLVVDINNVDMTYGDKESTISNQYGYTVNNGLVNEDSLKDVIADMTYENTAYNADGTTKDVIDGKYALENKDITVGGKYGNYEVTINNGTVMMNKADLNIKVDNANTTVGKMPSELTGTVEGLTNGDTLPTHDFALKDDSFISVSGNHENVIGIVIGGKFYELGDADWSNGLFANYDINYEMGDLAVSVVEMPDNWPNNRWDYLFSDNPFDRNENFRERKAEVNFVDGAMEI